jgi:hypothetical protein
MYDGEMGLEYLGRMMGGSRNSPNYHMYGPLMLLYFNMIGWVTDPQHTLGVSTKHIQPSLENSWK